MVSIKIFTVLIVTCLSVIQVQSKDPIVIPPALLTSKSTTNPGIKLRVTKKAVDYIIQMVGRILDSQVPNLKVDKAEKYIKDLDGKIKITNLHITNYKKPDSISLELSAPNQIKLSIKNSDVAGMANFDSDIKVGATRYTGVGTASAASANINLDVTAVIERAEDGKPKFRSTDCQMTIGSLLMDFTGTGNGVDLAKSVKGIIEVRGKEVAQQKVCERARKIFDKELNERFSKLGSIFPISKSTKPNPKDDQDDLFDIDQSPSGSPQSRGHNLNIDTTQLSLDNRLIQNPIITPLYIESIHRGEISLHGKGGTPFNPQEMEKFPDRQDKMLLMEISDYVMNSLMFSAYKEGNLTMKINPTNSPNRAKFLSLTCTTNPCFGNIFPLTSKKNPNQHLEIHVAPISMPYMHLANVGVMSILTNSRLMVFGTDSANKRKLWINSIMNTTSDGRFELKKNKIYGKTVVKTVSTSLQSSPVLEHSENGKINELGNYMGRLLEDRINNQLAEGIPLPILRYGNLNQPELVLLNGAIGIFTDFTLDEAKLRDNARKLIEKEMSQIQDF